MSGLMFPKPRPRKLEKADRVKSRASIDAKESAKVKVRSGGRCEVQVLVPPILTLWLRCARRAAQVHHMIGGRGKRGIGMSALAQHKQHVCDKCHQDITGGIGGKALLREGEPVPEYTDHYRRVR